MGVLMTKPQNKSDQPGQTWAKGATQHDCIETVQLLENSGYKLSGRCGITGTVQRVRQMNNRQEQAGEPGLLPIHSLSETENDITVLLGKITQPTLGGKLASVIPRRTRQVDRQRL